jgi:hypothetical protein
MRANASIVLVALALSCAGACSSKPDKDPSMGMPTAGTGYVPDSGIGGRAGGAGTAGEGGSGGMSASAYSVNIEAPKTRVCVGECVELEAEVQNGHEPFEYVWSGGLDEDSAGPHEVCPEETTTYEVVVTDTAIDGEFGRDSKEARASLELVVDEDCSAPDGGNVKDDGGSPDDGGVVDEAPGTTVLCSVRIPYREPNYISSYNGWESSSNVGTDAQGNFYVAGNVQGTIDLGEQTVTSTGIYDALLLKYNESCELVWAKTYGAAGTEMAFSALAVGPDGELVVTGTMYGTANFGAGTISSGFSGSGTVMGIDPDNGSVIWNEVYGSLFTNAAIWDVGIDDAGDISISGYASADTSFGGAPIGGPAEGNVAFFARLTSERAHRFSFSVQDSDLVAPFALHRSGAFVLTGWGQGTSVNIAGQEIVLGNGQWKRYVVLLDENGEVVWGHDFFDLDGRDDGGSPIGFWGGGIALDSDRNILIEHGLYRANGEGVVEEWPERISKLNVDGELQWTEEFLQDDSDAVFIGEGGLNVDSHDNILHSDDRSMIDRSGLDAGVEQLRNRMYVQKLSPDGEIIWRQWFDDAWIQWTWGLASAPDDAVWVTFSEQGRQQGTDGRDTQYALVIAKLAP